MNRVFLMLTLLGLTLSGCSGVDWFPEQVATPATTTATTSGTSGPTVLTVAAFSFTPITNAIAGSPQSSNAITVTLSSGTSAPISVSEGGKYKINSGDFTSVAGVVNNNDTVVVQHTAASGDGQRVTTTLTIGNKSATFSSTTANVSVAQFSMTPPGVVNATAGSPLTATTTVALTTGTSATISVAGAGQYKINSGAFTSGNGTVKNSDTVTVQHTTASGTEQTVTTLIIGDKSATFVSTTASAIFSVKDFSFAPLTGVVVLAPQTSEIITVGFNSGASAKISVKDGAYKINNGAFTSADGIVNDADKVTVQHTAASGDGQEVRTILTIGDRSAVFSSTTAITAVAPFSFTPASVTGVALGSLQTSTTTVALTSGTSAKISVTGGQYKIGNGTFTSADGVVNKGDVVVVQNTASSTASTSTAAQLVTTTLTIGEQSSTFSSTTAASTFIPLLVTNVTTGSTVTSNPIVVVLSSSTPVAISVTGGEYSINGGAFTSVAGTVKNNDLVTARHTAGATTKITVSTFVTIGGQNFPFSSTTI
jgi:hypothetical protein